MSGRPPAALRVACHIRHAPKARYFDRFLTVPVLIIIGFFLVVAEVRAEDPHDTAALALAVPKAIRPGSRATRAKGEE